MIFLSKSKFLYSFYAIVAVAFLALPAVAQEQTGGIEGTVRDSAGVELPGVTVEATSSSVGTITTRTDGSGKYRFPRLPSGVYVVRASLSGFNAREVRNVEVQLGKDTPLNMEMSLATVAETITVTAEAPIVDVSRSATTTSIAREQLELVPKGRDFTTVAAQAAGASQEGFAGGISVDGASGAENRFVIDGIDTTDPNHGVSGQNLITDFVEEIQVKTAGYQAEYGGSIGGVINAVTKSGTNQFDGQVGVYYGDRSWDGEERMTPYRSSPTLYRTYDEDDITRIEPFVSIGGPIMRDLLWFYAGYSQTELETNRQPAGVSSIFTQTDTRKYITANLKGNLGSRFLYKIAGNSGPRTVDNQLPARDGSTPASAVLDVDDDYETASYSAYADFIPTSAFYLSGRVGMYSTDLTTIGLAPGTPRIFFRNGVIPLPTTDPRYRPTGFATVPGATHLGTDFDLWERQSGSLDANYFTSGWGEHSLKAGVQYETIHNEVASGEVGNLYEIRWGLPDRIGLGVIGTYGSVHVRRFGTFGEADSNNLGFYLQDSWQVVPTFTLNIGIRTEQEQVPNYGFLTHPELPEYAFEFGYGDKLAPRLGFAWDVMGDQKFKVYGSWGLYYDIMKLQMSQGSFGGQRWIGYAYPLETLDWETLPGFCTTSENILGANPCPGLGEAKSIDLREPTDPSDPVHGVDPDLQPMEQEELQIGGEYLLTSNSAVGLRYVTKKLNAAIEDIGFYSCPTPTTCTESYFTGNPGLGLTANDPPGPVPGQPLAVRDYEAIELSYNRRFVNNWSARVGYTYSSLEGNWAGLGNSDEFGRTDPNVSRSFDAIHNSFDRFGQPVYGKLNTDRPHQLDAQVLYRAPFGTSVGINQYYGSGTPISTQLAYPGSPFFPFGRGDQGRTDSLTQTDLLLTHPFNFGGRVGVEASLNILNLFDEDTALLIDPFMSETDLCTALGRTSCDAEFFFANAPFNVASILPASQANPFYLKPNALGSTTVDNVFQARRAVRLGVKLTF